MEATAVLCLGLSQTIQRTAQAWRAEPSSKAATTVVDWLLAFTVDLVECCCAVQQEQWKLLFDGQMKDEQETGRQLQEIHELASQALEHVGRCVDLAAAEGGLLAGRERFAAAQQKMEQLRADFREGWPLVDGAEVEAARARHTRGESVALEDWVRGLDAADRP